MRTKAELRATRDRVGLTQAKLAEAVCVQVRSVKRWESPDAPQQAPDDVWDYLGQLLQVQDAIVDQTLQTVKESPAETVRMPYWASQEDYDQHHGGPEGGFWRVANATARAVAVALETIGYGVEWVDSNPVPEEAWE